MTLILSLLWAESLFQLFALPHFVLPQIMWNSPNVSPISWFGFLSWFDNISFLPKPLQERFV